MHMVHIHIYSLLCLAPGCSQAEITLAGSLVKPQLEALRQRKTTATVQTVRFIKRFCSKNKIFLSLETCDKMIPYMKHRMHTERALKSLVEEMFLECKLVSDALWLFTHLFTEDECFTFSLVARDNMFLHKPENYFDSYSSRGRVEGLGR